MSPPLSKDFISKFLEKCGELDQIKFKSRDEKRKLWEALITNLNLDVTSEGKSWEYWEKVWRDLKDFDKRLVAKIHKAPTVKSNGPARRVPFEWLFEIIDTVTATFHPNLVDAGLETSSPTCDAGPSVPIELSTTITHKASESSHIQTLEPIVTSPAASNEISQPTSTPGPTESPQCDTEPPRAITRGLVSRQRRPTPYFNTARRRRVFGQSRVDGLSAQLRQMDQRLNFLTQEHKHQRERELEKRKMKREERMAEREQRHMETVQWQTLMGRFLNNIEKCVNK